MRKKRAIRNFIAITLLAVIAVALTVFSFQVPNSYNKFNGFAKSMPKGRDFGVRVVAEYNVDKINQSDAEYQKDLKNVSNILDGFLKEQFLDYNIFKTENGFKIDIPVIEGSSEALSNLNNAGLIEFKTEDSETETSSINAEHIKSVEFLNNGDQLGVLINFTPDGQNALKTFTENAVASSGEIVILINGEEFSKNKIEESIDSNVLFIPGNYANEAVASASAARFNIGLNNVKLELSGDVLVAQPTLHEKTSLYVGLASIFVVVITLIALALNYKTLGLISGLALVFELVLTIILFVLLPNIILSMATLVGFIVAYALMLINKIVASNHIQQEIKSGKKIPTAVKFAFNKTNQTLINLNAPLLAIGLLFAWVVKGAVNMFIMPMLMGVLISWLFTMFAYKLMVQNYLPINSINYKKFGVKKIEEGVDNE